MNGEPFDMDGSCHEVIKDEEWVSVPIVDFSDEGIGRAIMDFLISGESAALGEFVSEASKRNIPFPVVEVRNEASLYELIAAVSGAIERMRSSS